MRESVDLGTGGVVSGEPEHVARAVAIWRSIQEAEREWVDALRAWGVKAAHPDDAWVDRERNAVHLVYPQYGNVRQLEVGDLIALGYYDKYRVVCVAGFSQGGWLSRGIVRDWDRYYVHFEEADVTDEIRPWDSDHTALVHVLWEAKRIGLKVDDYDALASLIMQSKWMRAVEQQATLDTSRQFDYRPRGTEGSTERRR